MGASVIANRLEDFIDVVDAAIKDVRYQWLA